MQSKINRITDILRRDDGISGAMHYTEQISWILFLKFLNDYENNKSDEAHLEGKQYNYVIDEKHRWDVWACPKTADGKLDIKGAKTGDDLLRFVSQDLFPYLKSFKDSTQDARSVRYKIGAIFEYLDNRIASGHTLREILDIIDDLNFQSRDDLFELSHVYEKLLKDMGSDGGNSGEFYTPRPVIKAMVNVVQPKAGQTVYDGAAGSAGFLIEAFNFMKEQPNLSVKDWEFLQSETFYGNEKTPLAYVVGVMNMILHGIESPNMYKRNTLTVNIRDIEEKDRYDIILANPPFGGKEKSQIQQNFPVQSNATELLFLQHFMKSLKVGGKAAIIVTEGVLFQTNNAFQKVKQELLENFNVHTILSLPAGVFLPYSGVKTNILFFDRTGRTSEIWYYEVDPAYKLTKNKPIEYAHLEDFVKHFALRDEGEHSWIIKAEDIKNFDLSAKNPNKNEDVEHISPLELLEKIKANDREISILVAEEEALFNTVLHDVFQAISAEQVRLAEIVDFVGGGTPSRANSKFWEGGIPWATVKDMNVPLLSSTQEFISEEGLKSSAAHLVPRGSLVIATRVGLGKVCKVNCDNLAINQDLKGILPKAGVNVDFLFYWFQSIARDIQSQGTGATVKGVKMDFIKNLIVPLPNLEIQTNIVFKLNKASSMVEGLEARFKEQLKVLQALKKSILHAAFSGKS